MRNCLLSVNANFGKMAFAANHLDFPGRREISPFSAGKRRNVIRATSVCCAAWVMAVIAWTVFENAAVAETIEYAITEDTRIDSDRTTNNYGDESLKMIINSADHYDGSYVRLLVDLPDASSPIISTATANGTLSSAKLWLNFWWISVASGEEFEDRGVVAHPLTQSFAEYSATFLTYDGTNTWANPGGDYDSSVSIEWTPLEEGQQAGWYCFDLTSLYASGYDLSNGLILMLDSETPPAESNSWCTYCADQSESGVGPYLEVTTVPEPGTWMLLATGLIGGAFTLIYRRNINRKNTADIAKT